MSEFILNTPVAFIIFNRPETTQKVFNEIRKAKPPVLLVIADGPRTNREGEAEKCTAARAVIQQVDWQCQVIKNYSEVNLGCKMRVSSGIDWVFETVEEAIIMEDDIVPGPDFFRYMQELLQRYRNNNQVMMISGSNMQFGSKKVEHSYFFSRYCFIWGWGTWRRAWKHYDVNMGKWPELKDTDWLFSILNKKGPSSQWKNYFDRLFEGKIDTWDGQWMFACWLANGLSIHPNVNLITNIGFGNDATHTTGNSILSNMKAEELLFPLNHPCEVARNASIDNFIERILFSNSIFSRVHSAD